MSSSREYALYNVTMFLFGKSDDNMRHMRNKPP